MQVQLIKGTDAPEQLVCRCARNDYMEEWIGDNTYAEILEGVDTGTKDEKLSEKIYGEDYYDYKLKEVALIRKLMEHRHFGPFEHPHATFAIKGMSRVGMQQLVRHRHATYDIQSQRYTDLRDTDLVKPPSISDPDFVGEEGEIGEYAEKFFEGANDWEQHYYEALRDENVPKEDARFVRGQGIPVNITFTMNARALMHLFDMRLAADAQWEIREMAEQVYLCCQEWMPITFTYYEENLRNRKNRLGP